MSERDSQIQEIHERQFEAGAVVFDEGAVADSVFVIQSGEVELSRQGAIGWTAVARLGAGELFGEISVIVGECRKLRAVAIAPTRVIELDAATFESMCVDRPEVAIRVIRMLAARLIDSERGLSTLGADDLLRPVVRVLVDAAEAAEGGMRIRTTLRQLSRDTGLSMLEAHRALHRLFESKALRLVENDLMTPSLESLTGCLKSRT
ncbi:MAG: Crp/Fnr family transcriptional regulator [Myxococcota bacterium]|nr:Crp/Fnr family transcriptional regulator [Myxococcota bacterium]